MLDQMRVKKGNKGWKKGRERGKERGKREGRWGRRDGVGKTFEAKELYI